LQQLKKNIYFSFYALMQCTKEDLSDPINYICILLISITRRVDLAMSVRLSFSKRTSLLVLELSRWNLSKCLISIACSI